MTTNFYWNRPDDGLNGIPRQFKLREVVVLEFTFCIYY